jgi:hypothetical protein
LAAFLADTRFVGGEGRFAVLFLDAATVPAVRFFAAGFFFAAAFLGAAVGFAAVRFLTAAFFAGVALRVRFAGVRATLAFGEGVEAGDAACAGSAVGSVDGGAASGAGRNSVDSSWLGVVARVISFDAVIMFQIFGK